MPLKKVLIFSFAYYPRFIGGAEVAVKEITDRISNKDYEFHLLTLRIDQSLSKFEKVGNVFVYRLGFSSKVKETSDSLKFPLRYNKYLYPFLAAWQGLKLSRYHQFAFTWAIMANYSGFGALFFKFLKPKIPMLLTLQEGDPFDYIKKRTGIFYPIFKMIFKKADQIQAISNYLAVWGKQMGFKGEVKVIPNGVDIHNFESRNMNYESRRKIREKLGLREGDVALITTSRLVIKNGVGDVIEALPSLPENVKFVILGEGYLKENLEFRIKNLKLEERVKMIGYVNHQEMPKYLKACDIFIRPSLSEGFGNSFIEAMAAGLPVIATRVGGIADFLEDNITGYVCEPKNPKSVAEAIKKCMMDPNKGRVVDYAYKMVKERYDWNLIAKMIKEVFDNLINKKYENSIDNGLRRVYRQ